LKKHYCAIPGCRDRLLRKRPAETRRECQILEYYSIAIKTLAAPAQPAPRLYAMTIPGELLRADATYPWLSEEDRTSAMAMTGAKRRAQFAAGRLLLRQALLRTCGVVAARWQIRAVNQGAPRLVTDTGVPAPVVSSLSHSGNVVLCGVAEGGVLGVDVEQCVPRRCGWTALAERALHPFERARLEVLSKSARWRGFYQAWTLKEALAKALGIGLALPFDDIAFSSDCRVEAAPDGYGVMGPYWRFSMLDVGEDAVAAVAWSAANSKTAQAFPIKSRVTTPIGFR
jgi:phosphopantetheinyl transferase